MPLYLIPMHHPEEFTHVYLHLKIKKTRKEISIVRTLAPHLLFLPKWHSCPYFLLLLHIVFQLKSISVKGGVKMHNRSVELPITIFAVNKAQSRFSLISLICYLKKFRSKSFTACTGYINSIFDHWFSVSHFHVCILSRLLI